MYGTVYQTTERARFSCVDGYFLLGSEVIHCNTSNYKWDGETNPLCVQVEIDVTKAKDVEGKLYVRLPKAPVFGKSQLQQYLLFYTLTWIFLFP